MEQGLVPLLRMDPLPMWALALLPRKFAPDLQVLQVLTKLILLHQSPQLVLLRSARLPSLPLYLWQLVHPSLWCFLIATSPFLLGPGRWQLRRSLAGSARDAVGLGKRACQMSKTTSSRPFVLRTQRLGCRRDF